MPEEENGNGNGAEIPEIPEVPEGNTLLEFVKNLLGFYGTGGDSVLGPLLLAAEQYLLNAGVKLPEPPDEMADEPDYEREYALYKTAIALKVKILHDGDLKGDLERALTSIVLQIKDYAGGEVV
ncbi:head-tail connector protein [Candidatus Darwinibacter acetoxidans]|jgi:hypothetical protein